MIDINDEYITEIFHKVIKETLSIKDGTIHVYNEPIYNSMSIGETLERIHWMVDSQIRKSESMIDLKKNPDEFNFDHYRLKTVLAIYNS